MDTFSIDQLRVFVVAADAGGFSAAARAMGRAQSAVTYAIQKLEADAGVALFDRSAYRPKLTDAGRALLPEARRILDGVGAFRAQAAGMSVGLEAELRLVVEAMAPMASLAPSLRDFQAHFPTVPTRVMVESQGAAAEALISGAADLGVLIPMDVADALRTAPVAEIELVAVAAPVHPLATSPGPLSADVLKEHLQLVLSGRATGSGGADYGVSGRRTWRVGDLGAKHEMLLAGLGWGSLPEHMARNDLDAGRLVRLDPAVWDGRAGLPRLPVVVAYPRDRAPGVAGRWLFDRLSSRS